MLMVVREENLQIYFVFNLKAFGYDLVPGNHKLLSCALCFVIDDHHVQLKYNNFKSTEKSKMTVAILNWLLEI